ncbi:nucleotidyltransferase and HEPN domain-containing protein [Asticcacaulis sp. ZE23SCel15]|uniref:nucleotidyltransferase and HEPN domain-containing protein n=1 Tax=Asticcacaulis sp. ZE23SCel15 TaxID=3059027 RepID=UPI00265F0911|nr:nucleotidyltransferase and HEPN domain-containing protein [Asticcacaulis sp. ZE23SCel15]WKL59096.1 nucleotidyltransferase and HEPN domain-containing protein [Asticcacaulis sp. ZE23SCel15]
MLTDQLSHLPDTKRRELERVVQVLFDEFEDATKSKLSDKKKLGRIIKVILFGSYARGDWVEDRLSGYRSDYDLLIVVNSHQFTDLHEYWAKADEHFIRELTVTQHIKTPVNFIVHSLEDVNDQLAKGRPFFSDIARDGIMLYEAPGHPLAKSKPLTDDEIKAEAQGHYDQWLSNADNFLDLAAGALEKGYSKQAAFILHQATESLYHCALLVLTLYSPKSHRITMLRSQAEALDARLKVIWPSETKLHRQAFDRLRRAYVEARYSAEYTVSLEELNWLNERIAVLRDTVETICKDRLAPNQPALK